jgi:hypothetical protein
MSALTLPLPVSATIILLPAIAGWAKQAICRTMIAFARIDSFAALPSENAQCNVEFILIVSKQVLLLLIRVPIKSRGGTFEGFATLISECKIFASKSAYNRKTFSLQCGQLTVCLPKFSR